ncbi:MAG: tellurium resistance protein TerC [Acidimicrobiales bacterium]|nr:MAG: tellurium resistance protein TerC [Acidimicrobiales bacterium]
MNVPIWLWIATASALVAILLADLIIIGRRPHEPSTRESSFWVIFYVALAVLFGLAVLLFAGPRYGGQFFAGWVTEYSLSVDNLFVFVIIMSRFCVPRGYQQKVLMAAIVLALLMRGVFIAAGAAAINQFIWVFYIFGAFLLYTAYQLACSDDHVEYKENALVRCSRRVLPMTDDYDSGNLRVTRGSRKLFTPMIVVMVAIGTADLLFAVDSIPAIFGLTKEAYLVFAANVFALMGLRQLYFLLGHLLERLVYLSRGLAVILGFIGVKLALEAMNENQIGFINGGEPISWAPHLPIWLSLGVIVVTLGVTAAVSLAKSPKEERDPRLMARSGIN